MTINEASHLDQNPISKAENLKTSMAGDQSFTKLDLSQAYLQVKLKEESHKYVVVNTNKGLFQYTPFHMVLHQHLVLFGGLWRMFSKGFLIQ